MNKEKAANTTRSETNQMDESQIDFSRGDKDIVFVQPDIDMEDLSEEQEPEKTLEEKMSERGLKWENAYLIGLFRSEFSLMLQEDAKIKLDGEIIYP